MQEAAITQTEAYKLGLKEFVGKRACRACGDKRRWFPNRTSEAACITCEPMSNGLSSGVIKASLVKHNKGVKKAQRDNWVIPVVLRQNFK